MSDGLSDGAMTSSLGEYYEEYLKGILAYLRGQGKEHLEEVIEAAKSYSCRYSRNLSEGLEERLLKLLNKDKQEWAKFLSEIYQGPDWVYEDLRQDLKSFSPFAGKLFLIVDYGMGFATLGGDVEKFVSGVLTNQKNWTVYDCDKYLMVLDEPNTEELYWVGCGISSVKGPRQSHPKE